jgi:hypothetical protein
MDILKSGMQNLKNIGVGSGTPELRDSIIDMVDPKSAALRVYQDEEEKKAKRKAQGMKKGGSVKPSRGDGCAIRGKTKGRMV